MARVYTLRRRAEQQAELASASWRLPSRCTAASGALTSMSMVAERAAVQRHTLYAHFPNQRSLNMACSGHTNRPAITTSTGQSR